MKKADPRNVLSRPVPRRSSDWSSELRSLGTPSLPKRKAPHAPLITSEASFADSILPLREW